MKMMMLHLVRIILEDFLLSFSLVEACVDDSFHIYLGGGYNYYSLHLV